MKLALEILAVTFAGIVNYGLGAYFLIKYPDYTNRFNNLDDLIRRWANSLLGISVILSVAYNQPDGFASIGIHLNQGGNNINVIFIGFFAISIYVLIYYNILKLIYRLKKKEFPPEVDPSQPSRSMILRFQNKWERCSYLSVLPLIVISEDLIYRGYLVLFLGGLTGTYVPWAIISVTLSILIHLYQGRDIETILSHLLFASIFVGLAIVTENILAPISAHLYYNELFSKGVWKRAKEEGIPVSNEISKRGKKSYDVFIGVNIGLLITMAINLF